MITVQLDREGFEYDIHSLVKAFYPETDVKVFLQGTKDLKSDETLPELVILRDENRIEAQLWKSADARDEESVAAEAKAQECRESLQGAERRLAASVTEPICDHPDKARIKNQIKNIIYRMLLKETGKQLPWGTLTGIRPTKIAMGLLEQGRSREDILQYMRETYDVSQEKAVLSVDIAEREKRILADIHYRDGYSLYIGIPFCPTTCLYCSFTSFPIALWRERVTEYLEALKKEMEAAADLMQGRILDSVYIGGGTPTTLSADELEYLIQEVKKKFNFITVKEFTVEAGRADSITEDKLRVLKKYGVTRISVNPQTMNDKTLKLIGRQHTVAQVEEAFRLARRCGFDNINMDLILGLPGEDEEDVRRTVEAVKALQPDSLTVHSLAIKRASKLNQWIQENGIQTLHNTDETMRIAAEAAESMGLLPYYLYRQKNMSGNFENVGYAREGCYGIYNILIMEEKQTIMALGAGTITKRVYPDGRIERCDNVKEVALYIEKIDEMIERKRRLCED